MDTHKYVVFPRVQWSSLVSDGPFTPVESMERRISGLLTEWFAVHKGFSSVGLLGKGAKLHLLPTAILDRFKIPNLDSFYAALVEQELRVSKLREQVWVYQDGPNVVRKEDSARGRRSCSLQYKDVGKQVNGWVIISLLRWCAKTGGKKRNLIQ